MKILPYEPGKAAGHGGMDNSRLGLHCRGINISQLQKEKHGIVLLGLADDTGIKNVGGRIGAKDGPSAARSRLYKFTTGLPKNPVYDLGDLLPEDTIEKTHEAAA